MNEESHSMDQLYTPWRMNYLQQNDKAAHKPHSDECVFCAKPKVTDDSEEHIVARSTFVYVTLNLYPYNNGHAMVIPYAHVPSMEHLPTEGLTDLMLMTNKTIAALRKVYTPHAFNVGANIGKAAGAGIAGHFHLHIVPRWEGDTNFMTPVSGTRVIPELLLDTWRKLREAWV
jgi:ATP adenylyltransferase